MGGTDSELIVASVALLISFIALSATFMQVLQQYYASASGYSQCSESVMGKWAKSKSRRFSWEELRFEVQFDAPVIFVSPPTNKSGPVPEAKIFFLDGSPESQEDTHTTSDMDLRKEYKEKSVKERIHTADNERASWLVLLSAVQRMEAKSREWQQNQYLQLGPPGDLANRHGLPREPPSLHESHTLTVALQPKRKSWDTMPASVSRPYATTTMCHLIEMMAVLGVYWKEFDRSRSRYRAEGNGFLVMGEKISDLGLLFSFQIYGECHFGRTRVIPVDFVKELCFGYVPTIYRETVDARRLRAPSDELRNLGSLQMATKGEIAETLVVVGCNRNTVQYFLDDTGNTSHLFPMSFEILGMLARTLHIQDMCFTYLPNPTPDRWDGRSLSLVKIMESLLLLKALHTALDDTDEVLTAKELGCPSAPHEGCRPAADAPQRPCADEISRRAAAQHSRRVVVQDVLRTHIQEVLRLLNEREDKSLDTQRSAVPDSQSSPPSFEDINEASPNDRQHKFMEVYFQVVRQSVVRTCRRTVASDAPSGFGLRSRGAGGIRAGAAVQTDPRTEMPETVSTTSTGDDDDEGKEGVEDEEEARDMQEQGAEAPEIQRASLAHEQASHDDIWCVLVFRMICWLMLHDFNKLDVQISKSELLGSRMPVYIA
ncbi:hypothetical protein CDD83_7122 [Cordyceps sp. RAO-2017]|nr:hypothetical protein CDD83_7122 [Cordyceps sp. RAO-2017]